MLLLTEIDNKILRMKGKRPRNEIFYKEFALRLKELIGEKSLSEVARDIDGIVSQKTLWDYVNGISMPGPDVLVKISETFKVSIDYLLKGQISLFPKDDHEKRLLYKIREAEQLQVSEKIDSYSDYVIDKAKKEKESSTSAQSKNVRDKAG